MDISESLKLTENNLRDLIFSQLFKNFNEKWVDHSGVSADRIIKWEEKQVEDRKRVTIADTRILYYADFYDLRTIIKKNWDKCFKEVFEDLKEFETLFTLLEKFRNPDAHRRELLPYQKHLAIGICGKLRSQITSFYSKLETGESYYPRVEFAQDNLGNSYSLNLIDNFRAIKTPSKLRPGDRLEFTISAFDPLDGKILYAIDKKIGMNQTEWVDNGNFSFEITNSHVSNSFWIFLAIRSERDYHASYQDFFGKIDDEVRFGYEVLPPK